MLLLFVFFFQAEDGIRDTSVTGVQTCALPISFSWAMASGRAGRSAVRSSGAPSGARSSKRRSEERRVGKECRSRGARYHYKEKRRGRRKRRGVRGEIREVASGEEGSE